MIINSSAHQKLKYFHQHPDQFVIVSDFDSTLNTLYNHEWQKTQGVVALLHHYGTLSDQYSALAHKQFKKYEPIERDTTLDFSDRLQAMIARWTENIGYLVSERLQYDILRYTVGLGKIQMRSGTKQLITKALKHDIPFAIFSASSIGFDAIDLTLRYRGVDLDPEYIVGNKMARDDEWYLVWLESKLIHSLNKTEEIIQSDPQYWKLQRDLQHRTHGILIGDQIHDAYMLEDREDRVLLRIGLRNDDTSWSLEEYRKHFDIVIQNDGWFDELNKLLFGSMSINHTKEPTLTKASRL